MWAFYWDMIGFGAVIPQQGITHYLHEGPTFEMALDVRYKRTIGMVGFGVSSHTLKHDIPINGVTWQKGATTNLGFVYLNGGYVLYNSYRWSIYPFAGVGYSGFSAAEEDIDEWPELKHLKLNSFFTQIGIGVDFRFKMPDFPYNRSGDELPGRLSLRYSFRTSHFENKINGMDGFTHSIVLSWGIGGRPSERVR